jgi:hypothetical protein
MDAARRLDGQILTRSTNNDKIHVEETCPGIDLSLNNAKNAERQQRCKGLVKLKTSQLYKI